MPKTSAGILLYRLLPSTEVFLVHPGGPFFARKDLGSWSIPKGELSDGEDPLAAAKREFEEETGTPLKGNFIELAPIKQSGGKMVLAWAVEGAIDADAIFSNTFETEWPPKSGKKQSFPEVDRAAWFNLQTAKQKINAAQAALVDQLAAILERL